MNQPQSIFQKINNVLFPQPKPEYKVTTNTPKQVSEVTNSKDVVILTVHTQNHIEVATWLCHLLNSKK